MSHFPTKGSQGVRFMFTTDNQIESVAVAGTFNNWNGDRNFMYKTEGENVWELELPIPKGRHLYKFVVNGDDWILDPQNPSVSEDGQNNSAITVTEHGDVLLRTSDISEEQPGYMYENYTALPSPDWIKKDDSLVDEDDIHDWKNVIYQTGTGNYRLAEDSSELWLEGYESVIFRK